MNTYWVVYRVRLTPDGESVLLGALIESLSHSRAARKARRRILDDHHQATGLRHVSTELRTVKMVRGRPVIHNFDRA